MGEPSEFHQAVINNRVADVKRFLREGESPDSLAVVFAIQNKAHDVLKVLIGAGADVNKAEAHWRYTPLVRALEERNTTAFKILLKAGASTNKRAFGAPLHCAATENLPEFAKLCIAAGANVNLRDGSGNTPLMWAASMGSIEVVKILLKAGANPLALNRADRTPCQLAADNNEKEIVRLLAPISQRLPPAKRGIAALCQAVCNQDMAAVEKWLAKGVYVNATNRWGSSPLRYAIRLGSVPLVNRLIEAGVEVNKVDRGGTSYLDASLSAEKYEIAKILLKAGALPKPPGNRGEDAIWLACALADVELVDMLLKKGANASLGLVAAAVYKRPPEIIKLLLAVGADVNSANERGRTVLAEAVSTPRVLFTTKKHPSGSVIMSTKPSKEPLKEQSAIEVVKLLLEHGADVHLADEWGRIPLTYANSPTIVELLINAGAKLDIRDNEGHDVRYWLKTNGVKLGNEPKSKPATLTALSPKQRFGRRPPKRRRM